ncbi:type IV pilus modification PilV family protein [Pseudoalteromonas tunicata]|uniref:Prepilin-type N-terminal cleavage/methylation domain-containing protein n=1 Tax=Pseudoalteromonas tunicata D2 TaxID=87626 RepID=A4C8P5_9GAMM|nr:prepilin-type N-terminal cleavage/methylation domain-containing protein [Pseudoalteromonas tunicata]ATC93461.1 type IV pilus assembly protein PilV [Pseudoalteromonas tunicata]EAR28960.1 hypothetical protein PTD2_07949 [Pseudoalteromonas tunicata D2]
MSIKSEIKNQKGFSLLEVVIAMLVASIALLGLASGQAKSLQFASNSLDYTVSIIQANNAIERVWANLCGLQHGAVAYDAGFNAVLTPALARFTLTVTPAAPAAFSNNLTVKVSWNDDRMNDGLANEVTLSPEFPSLKSGCSL